MTDPANEIIVAYDALPESDRHEVAAVLLRRILDEIPHDLSDEALILSAEQLFLELDADERTNGESSST